MRTDSVIQRKANEVLRRSGIEEKPVHVMRIAETLGARIRPEILENGISGGLYRHADGPVIGVNAQHHPNRQRFTIAHEIGHLVLHESEDYFVDRVFRRDTNSSAAVDQVEIEANKFAACLLMPKSFVKAAIADYEEPLRSENVEELARSFQVSQQAMTLRLINLQVSLEES
jgi:Zn-dependent peptidase ImmA (M78 family)